MPEVGAKLLKPVTEKCVLLKKPKKTVIWLGESGQTLQRNSALAGRVLADTLGWNYSEWPNSPGLLSALRC